MKISEELLNEITRQGFNPLDDIRCCQAAIYNKVVNIDDDEYVFDDDKHVILTVLLPEKHSVIELGKFLDTLNFYDESIHGGGSYKRYIGRIDEPMQIEVWFNDGSYGKSTFRLPPDDYMRKYNALEIIRIPPVPVELIKL
jgi:hypothetical protein